MSATCHRCGHHTQFVGTSPSGADCFQCPHCDHVQLMAVSKTEQTTTAERTA